MPEATKQAPANEDVRIVLIYQNNTGEILHLLWTRGLTGPLTSHSCHS